MNAPRVRDTELQRILNDIYAILTSLNDRVMVNKQQDNGAPVGTMIVEKTGDANYKVKIKHTDGWLSSTGFTYEGGTNA